MMKAKTVLAAAMLAGVLMTSKWGLGEDPKPTATSTPASAALDRLKELAGEWVSASDPAAGVQVAYRVISGGSTVMETLFPGTPHEMVTMYHLDGDDLVLTHYCAVGNQPRMKWIPGDDSALLKFDFTGGTNIKPEGMHMHSAMIDLSNPNRVKATWTPWTGGKAQKAHELEFVRKAG